MADEFVEKALLKARDLGLKIRNRIISTEGKSIEVNLADVALSTGVGISTFPLCMGTLQTGVFRPLRMTSNIRVIGSVCGGISVLTSGGAASLAFLASAVMLRQVKDNSLKVFVEKFLSFVPVERYSIDISVCSKDIPLYGFANLFVFKLLGGKFRSVLPSNLIYPGAFAKGYIPAKGQNYASNAVKQKLTLLGKKYGCHSCGKRWGTSFVGDHMPPNKLVRKGQQQRFYPQCTGCSNLQGAALSSISRKLHVKTHGSSLRLYHLWLPLPVPLAMLRNYAVSDKSELQDPHTECEKQTEDGQQGLDEYLNTLAQKIMLFLKVNDKGNNGDED